MDPHALARLRAERLDWRFKAVPPQAHGTTLSRWLDGRPRLSDLPTPVMTLDAAALEHNIAAMAAWCARAGLAHAPHGKPTMAPALWNRQLEAGACGITVANAAQLRVAREFGVPRVLLANQLASTATLRWLGEQIADGLRAACFVDSIATAALADDALRGTEAVLDVCVELG
ncbi:MAG: amino acid deaminase, partial [Stackebrandtia sp.]